MDGTKGDAVENWSIFCDSAHVSAWGTGRVCQYIFYWYFWGQDLSRLSVVLSATVHSALECGTAFYLWTGKLSSWIQWATWTFPLPFRKMWLLAKQTKSKSPASHNPIHFGGSIVFFSIFRSLHLAAILESPEKPQLGRTCEQQQQQRQSHREEIWDELSGLGREAGGIGWLFHQ